MSKIKKDELMDTRWIPNKEDNRHTEVPMVSPDGVPVGIDEGMSDLISAMWDRGFDTQFCCEGYEWNHPESGDEHSWAAEAYKAYILMPWTPRTFDLAVNLLQNFFRFSGSESVNWELHFETTEHFGGMNRICLRFPKIDIPHLTEFVKEQY